VKDRTNFIHHFFSTVKTSIYRLYGQAILSLFRSYYQSVSWRWQNYTLSRYFTAIDFL